MTRKYSLREWFPNTDKQLKWSARYLLNHGYGEFGKVAKLGYEAAITHLEDLQQDAAGRELIRKMQVAWREDVARNKSDRKSCNFKLAPDAIGTLKKLASAVPKPQNQYLEDLIRDESAETRKANREEALARKKVPKVQEVKLRVAMPPELRAAQAELRSLKATNAEWLKVVEELAFDFCRGAAYIKAKGLSEIHLDSIQAIGVKRDAEDLVKYHQRNVRRVLVKVRRELEAGSAGQTAVSDDDHLAQPDEPAKHKAVVSEGLLQETNPSSGDSPGQVAPENTSSETPLSGVASSESADDPRAEEPALDQDPSAASKSNPQRDEGYTVRSAGPITPIKRKTNSAAKPAPPPTQPDKSN